MRRSWILVLVASLLGAAVAGAAERPMPVAPNLSSFSIDELSSLVPGIVRLMDDVEYGGFGAHRPLGTDGWPALQFARYAAGILEYMGYRAVVVSDGAGEASERVWVLVTVQFENRIVWVPVDPLPRDGESASQLGRIPLVQTNGGFDYPAEYGTYGAVVPPVEQNRAPLARIQPPQPPTRPNRSLLFRAIGSTDLDGEVVLYLWEFGDGTRETTTTNQVRHAFSKEAVFDVRVTVFDAHGATGSAALRVPITREDSTVCVPCRSTRGN